MTLVGCGCHGSAPFHHRARFCRRYCGQRTQCRRPESCWRLFASFQETQGPLLLKSFTFLNLQLLPTCCPSLQRLICVFIYFVSVCVRVCGMCVQSPWGREEGVGFPEPESSAGALSTFTCSTISPAAPFHIDKTSTYTLVLWSLGLNPQPPSISGKHGTTKLQP